MHRKLLIAVATVLAIYGFQVSLWSQNTSPSFEKKGYRLSKWGNAKDWELVTVSGPSKMIFLSGVGGEDENSAGPDILHQDSALEQCRYAEDKIKRLLAQEGAKMGDVVKVVLYLTDIRYQADVAKCENEAFGGARPAVHTTAVISQLAHPGMMLEIDVTAMVSGAAQRETSQFEKNGYHYSKWGNIAEVMSVSGPSKMIFISGMGAEDETSTGEVPAILHLGNSREQCRYAMSKITKLLAREGATIADIVKTTSYVTDQRQGAGGCETEPDPKAPRPAHTALNVAQLAYPGMLVQLDVTAIVPANRVTTQR